VLGTERLVEELHRPEVAAASALVRSCFRGAAKRALGDPGQGTPASRGAKGLAFELALALRSIELEARLPKRRRRLLKLEQDAGSAQYDRVARLAREALDAPRSR